MGSGFKRFVEHTDMTPKGLFTVDVDRRADFSGYSLKRNVLAVKKTVVILEIMHAEDYSSLLLLGF